MFSPQSVQLTSNGLPVHLHLFSTGRIAGRLSTQWEPIWVLVIDHPEGIFLVDTGERARNRKWYLNILYKFDLDRDQEVDRQLALLNLKPHQIILTHLHFDHIDGLYHFPQTPTIHPGLKDYNDTYGPFAKAHYLTKTKDLAIIHTPGHTRDHCSVLIKTDTHHILFGGDVAPNQHRLTDPTIKAYAQQHPLIVLLTHDPGSNVRLATLEPLPSSKTGNPPPPHP